MRIDNPEGGLDPLPPGIPAMPGFTAASAAASSIDIGSHASAFPRVAAAGPTALKTENDEPTMRDFMEAFKGMEKNRRSK